MLKKFASLILFLSLSITGVHADDIQALSVGFKKIKVTDPVSHQPMETVAFFPETGQSRTTTIGPYQIAASGSSAIKNGVYPVILLSHGSSGSLLGHHDLVTGLASKGFIVVSVNHPGDNFRDASRAGSVSVIYGRPLQISAALTAVLEDPLLGAHIDSDRIGFAGFSAGGTTGLILAGAKPILSRLAAYCAGRPEDRHVCEAKGEVARDRPDLVPVADSRIRAFALLAPLSVIFSPEALKSLRAPLQIFVGERDKELSPRLNAISLAENTGAGLDTFTGAGHFIFLAPCSPDMKRAQPELCHDAKGVDREKIHRQVLTEMATFFGRLPDHKVR